MSTTIDQKVVEMRFDNQHFEKNVNTTMSSLDKLKQKLNFSGASKGLDELNNSAKNNNMGVLANSVEVVRNKFSALEVMGITALANITNSAVNAGKRIVKSLTVDPVTTGFNEYELKMGSIQTIMASTGESLEVVNSYLNELNKYSDQTIYSFSDMTQNIGKFTNAGVKLEDAVMAIKGISNEAAVSGANANEASRAMYNFAQALSAGYVKLIDWKSIENANMATVEFKEQLIEAAVAAGTLEKQADGMYKVLTTNAAGSTMDETISSTKMFNDSLNYQWMTTEVLVNTLRNYADETTEIGKKATQAATEVKTFSQMMDTLKESAQSGWATTWEIVFGDFYEGKKLWTGISKIVGGLIDKMSDLRNNMLRGALTSPWEKLNKKIQDAGLSTKEFNEILEEDLGETAVKELTEQYGSLADALKKGKVPIDNIRTSIKKLLGVEEDVVDKTKKVTGATEAVNKSLKDLDKIAQRVIKGEFGNGAKRMEALAEAGYDYATVQNRVNELLGDSTRHVSKNADAMTELSDAQKKASEGIAGHADSLASLNDDQLKSMGYTEEQIEILRELQETAEGTGSSIDDLIDSMTTTKSGRDLLFESFGNIGEELKKIFDAVATAWQNVFGNQEDLTEGFSLYNLISEFHKLTESMEISENSMANFQSIVQGIFSGFDLTWSLASASTFGVIKIINELLKIVGTSVPDALAFLANGLTKVNKWVEENTIFGSSTKWADIAGIIAAIADGIMRCFNAFKNLVKIQPIVQKFKDAFAQVKTAVQDLFGGVSLGTDFLSLENITKAIENFFTKIETWIKNIDNLPDGESIGMHIVTGIAEGIKNTGSKVIEAIISVGTAIATAFCDFFGINSPSLLMMKFGVNIVQGLTNGIANGAKGLGNKIVKIGQIIVDAITGFFKIKSPSRLMMTIGGFIIAGLIAGLVSKNTEIGTAIQNLTNFCINGFKNLGSAVADMIQKIDFGKLLAVGLSAGLIWAIKSLADAVALFTSPLKAIEGAAKSISGFFDGVGKALQNAIKLNTRSKALMNLAIAIAVLAASVWVLAQLDGKKLLGATAAIIVLAGALVGITFALEKLGGVSQFKFNYLALLGIAATLMLMAVTFNLLSKFVDGGNVGEVVVVFVGMVAGLVLIMKALGTIADGKDIVNIKGAGKVFTKLAIALLIMVGVIKLISLLEPGEIIKGIATIAALTLLFKMIIKVFRGTEADAAVIKQSGKCIRNISVSLLLMIGVIKLASMLSISEIIKGGLVVAGIAVFFAAIIKATKNLTTTNAAQITAAGNMMLKVSAAMMLMAFAVKIIGGMSLSEIGKGLLVIGALSLLCAGLIAVSKYSGKHASKAGAMLIEISAALLILSLALFLLTSLPSEGIGKALGIITALSAIFAGLIAVTYFAKNAHKVKGAIIAMTIAIGVMAIAIVALSLLDPEKVKNAALCLGGVIGMFALLVAAMSCLKAGKKTWVRNLTTILVLTLIAGALGYLVVSMSKNIKDADSAVASAKAIGTLLLALSGSLYILSNSKSISKKKLPGILATLGILVVVSAILGAVITGIGKCDPESAVGAAIGIGILLLAMSESLAIISTSKSISKKKLPGILATLAMLTLVVAGLGLVIKSMNDCDPISAVGSAVALSILLTALCGAFDILASSKSMTEKKLNSTLVMLGTLTLVVGALGLIIYQLAKQDPLSAIGAATAIGILLTTLSASFNIIATSKSISEKNLPGVIKTLGMLTVMAVIATGLIAVLSLCDPMKAIGSSIALSILLVSLSFSMQILSKSVGITTAAVYPAMLMGVVLLEIAIVLGLIQAMNIEPSIKTSLALSILLVALSAACLILSRVGPMAPLAVQGAVGLIGVIAVLGTAAILLGEVMSLVKPETIDKWKNGLQTFLDFIVMLATGLGEAIGGFIEGALSFLPDVGKDLSEFMKNADYFISVTQGIKEEDVKGISTLCDAILTLTGASFISAIPGLSLPAVGLELAAFGAAIQPFLTSIGNVKPEAMEGVKYLTDAILSLTKSELINGISNFLGIKSDLSSFGEKLTSFGEAIVGFSAMVSADGAINEKAIQAAKDAADIMVALQDSIEPMGGVVGAFTGRKDLGKFGEQLVAFGQAIVGFSATVSVDGAISETAIESAKNAGMLMTELQKAVEPMGGLVDAFAGTTDLDEFGRQLSAFGGSIAAFSKSVTETQLDQGAMTTAQNIGMLMTELQAAIPENKIFDGKMSLSEFGTKIMAFGESIVAYSGRVSSIDTEKVNASTTAATALVGIAESASKIDVDEVDKFKVVKELGSNLKSYYDNVSDIDAKSVSSSVTNIKKLVELVKNMVGLDASGVASFKEAISSLGETNFNAIIQSFNTSITKMPTIGVGIIDAITKGMQNRQPAMIDLVAKMIDIMLNTLKTKDVNFVNLGQTYANKIAEGVSKSGNPMLTAFTTIVARCIVSISNYKTSFYNVGSDLVTGFANGISDNAYKAIARSRAMANAAYIAAKNTLDINSPSRIFAKLGSGVVEGFVKGIRDNERDSSIAAAGMANESIKGFSSAISRINDYFSGNIDAQPTIRPVLDLSDVKSGAASISGMFNTPTVGVASNVSAINTMMNQRNQNGPNADVISALDKLRGDLGNIGGTSYNINGITYDDGSNIANAIKVIARAAIQEGRI